MVRFSMEKRLPLLAIIKGLRDSGEISDRALASIGKALREAAAIPDDYGHRDTADGMRALADDIEAGKVA
jgi:hypothetical protein